MATASAETQARALEILKSVAVANPRAYSMCHAQENAHPEAYDFVILATRELNKFDSKFGLNGKRGSSTDISSDALFYGSQSEAGSVVDFLRAAGTQGNDTSFIVWQDVSPSGPGKWIDPMSKNPVGSSNPTEPVGESTAFKQIKQLRSAFLGMSFTDFVIYANKINPLVGFKRASADRPISADTLGVKTSDGHFEAIKIDPVVSSFGIVGPPQQWINPVVGNTTPGNPPVPAEPVKVKLPTEKQVTEFALEITSDYSRASHPLDGGIIIHFFYTLVDMNNGMSWEDSFKKHRGEWCTTLGVTVD